MSDAAEETVESANMETQIQQLFDFREQKRALEAEVKVINATMREIEIQLIEAMADAGISKCTAEGVATVSIKEQEVASMKDFAEVADWVAIDPLNRISLFQKRISSKAYEDFALAEATGDIPGIERSTLTKVNLRVAR